MSAGEEDENENNAEHNHVSEPESAPAEVEALPPSVVDSVSTDAATTPAPPAPPPPVALPLAAAASPDSSPDAKLYIGLAVVFCAIIVLGAPLLLGNQPLPSSVISTQEHSGKPVDLDAAPVTDTAGGALKLGQSVVDLLEARLHAEPQNKVLVKELALAYRNQAVRQEDDVELALDSLWRSYALDPGAEGTVLEINKMLLKSGQNPTDFAARAKSGDAQARQDCLYGAFSEYSLALACAADGAVEGASHESESARVDGPTRAALVTKIEALKRKAEASNDDNINGAFYLKVGSR
ncbi:MAG: hypothetical protein KGS72_19165 [Cyanobacteria bacterium REEB67]|nr:hypothetical protein [Cyanobacteria bacterium REEB67]